MLNPDTARGDPRSAWVFLILAVASVFGVLAWVDLSPRVEADFFFSEGDPQLAASVEIDHRFPSPPQVIIRVASAGSAGAAGLGSDAYRSSVRELSRELAELEGLIGVHSVTTRDARQSPLWRRLLLTPDGRATNIVIQTDGTDPAILVPRIEEVVNRFDGRELDLSVSGVPYVIELIRRSLFRDLIVFSSAALVVFGVVVTTVYRNWRIALGTLAACLTASALTISIANILNIKIGLLTANIATVVFVLTLSHIVFLTANWQRSRGAGASTADESVAEAVRMTRWPSFWSMFTTLSGFLSLLIASARPLRELGMAGAIGALTAMAVAYTIYPAFLRAVPVAVKLPSAAGGAETSDGRGIFPRRRPARWLLGLGALSLLGALGIPRLSTDPGLLSYFGGGTALREGLEVIDRDGGSSSLNIVVRDPEGRRIDTDEVNTKMWALQRALEADSSVGVVMSPALLLGDARLGPLAGFLSWGQLLDILESPRLNRVALSFVTPERDQALFFLRMRESARSEPRDRIVARVTELAERNGFEVVLVGGQYDLQAQLGRLIAGSLKLGLGGLLLLFVGVAFVVSRSRRVTIAMVGCLVAIPLVTLGTMGHVGIALDIIASPAANVALAMGVDSMIHLVVRARRLRSTAPTAWAAWLEARAQLWPAVLGATLIICTGFGIFSLSTFPPTQRFGIAVILGTLAAALMALVALPFGAAAGIRVNED